MGEREKGYREEGERIWGRGRKAVGEREKGYRGEGERI